MKHLAIILFFLSICQFQLKGEHIIGGEFSYTCLSEGNYNFLLTLYRDCGANGAPFDSGAPGSILGTVTIFSANTIVEVIILDAPIIDLVALDVENDCAEVPNLCIERGQYLFNLELPISNEPYHIVYQRCCRNNTISNIIDPGAVGLTFVQEITPAAQILCNSSPLFLPFNKPLVCANENFTADHGAFDADGDQLIFTFCDPLNGGTVMDPAPNPDLPPPYDNVSFILPEFSTLNPLGPGAMVSIDSNTGVISGTATLQGQFVAGICIDEYRNGNLLSRTRRDFQFNVIQCDSTTMTDTLYVQALAGDIYEGVLINSDTTLFFSAESSVGCDSLSVHIVNVPVSTIAINLPEDDFFIYPNPVRDIINLQIEAHYLNPQYSIYNVKGQLLKSSAIPSPASQAISISELPAGVYYIAITHDNGRMINHFIKI